jgi:6-hydroxycyclohex-1-ene-1-carbonyl-CoA dehydrogenase
MNQTTAWVQSEAKGELKQKDFPLNATGDDAVVKVSGCGVCHTDVGFWDGSVKPRGGWPLVLGHEASGVVIEAADKSLIGKQVVVPSVWPCGQCGPCKAGRETACLKQKMPGNDVPGAFAGHVVVPARCLAPVPRQVSAEQLAQMSVTADAIATPMEAVIRSGLKAGDLAYVVGTGGLGGFLVQMLKVKGAKVVALDVNEASLTRAREFGAHATINVTGLSEKDVKARAKGLAKELGAPEWGFKIFETSGTAPGQRTAYDLLGPCATLMVVGYTPAKLELRLSNLMAFDASALGVWGSTPRALTEAVELVANGKIVLAPFVEMRPMAQVNEVLHLAHEGKLGRRVVLLPDTKETN